MLKLPESDINSDTSFFLGLGFIDNTGILEETFTHFGGLQFELSMVLLSIPSHLKYKCAS